MKLLKQLCIVAFIAAITVHASAGSSNTDRQYSREPAKKSDVIIQWNNSALAAIRARNTSPPVAARNLAIVHTAVYDAVNGIEKRRNHRFRPYLVRRNGPPGASQEAAASAAAHRALVTLWPIDQPRFDTEYAAILATMRDG